MPHSPVTILNVEEEQTTRQARSLTLRLAGYRVFDAVHTEEAVRLSTQEQPALCILPSEINQQWKLWADRAPVLMWMNGPSGCEFVNAAYLRFLGVTDRDTAGYQWAEFVHPDDRDGYVAGYLRAVEERRLFEATFRFRRFDGEYRWMKSVAIPRIGLHDEFLGYVGSTVDVTDIYQSHQTPGFLRAEDDPTPNDSKRHAAGRLVTLWRKVLSEYGIAASATLLALGSRLALDPFLGNHFPYVPFLAAIAITASYCSLGPSVTAIFLSGLAANWFFLPPRHSLELEGPTQQVGFVTYVVASLLIVAFGQAWRRAVGVSDGLRREVLDRQRADEALRASQERLQLAMDAAHMGSWDWDMLTGDIVWTPQHEIMLGYQPGTPHRTYADFKKRLHPEDVRLVETAIRHAVEQRKDFHCEFRVQWPDGSIHWISGSGIFHRDATDRPIRMVGIIQDITAHKRRERNLLFLSEMQKAFVVLSSAQNILTMAGERIAAHLNLTHCCLVEIHEAVDQYIVLHDQHVAGVPNLEGVHCISDFHSEEERQLLRTGGTLVIHDLHHDSRTSARLERFTALGIGALVNSSYVADGRWKFVLHASRDKAYSWPPQDSELLADLAERIYVRLERSRRGGVARKRRRDAKTEC
jgi:PAS domain S-box-containing protein